jgi:hypothetical protein
MTNWHDPILLIAEARSSSNYWTSTMIHLRLTVAFVKLVHVVAGVYL